MIEMWSVRLQLGAWFCTIDMPKSLYPEAQDAINKAAQAVIDMRDGE
tara:strand:+ start:319 stop:459 length:141 start_codon:yes stop_codon:yes gene_type:complete